MYKNRIHTSLLIKGIVALYIQVLVGCSDSTSPKTGQLSPTPNPEQKVPQQPPQPRVVWPLYPAQVDGRYGYINQNGDVIVDFQFADARKFNDELAAVRTGEKWGFIGKDGEFVITPQFAEAGDFSEGLAAVALSTGGNTWGYIDKRGRLVIPPKYNEAYSFSDGYAFVWEEKQKGGSGYRDVDVRLHFIDPNGKDVGEQAPNKKFHVATAKKTVDFNGVKATTTMAGIRDKSGKYVLNPIFQKVSVVEHNFGLFSACKDGALYLQHTPAEIQILSKIGRNFRAAAEGFNCALLSAEKGQISEYLYQHIDSFHEGLAAVVIGGNAKQYGPVTGGQWGFISTDGVLSVIPQYDEVKHFSEGFAAIKKSGKWGFINNTGQVVIPPAYNSVESFTNGLALVDSTKWIDQQRKIVFSGSRSQGTEEKINKTPSPENDSLERVPNQNLTKTGSGTMFSVSTEGYAVTNHHVVTGCKKLRSGELDLILITSDISNDLALLKYEANRLGSATLSATPKNTRQGEEISVFGFPLNSLLSSGGNLTPGVVSATSGLGNNSNQFQITAPIQPGSSGSPVMNKKGEVIGVVAMKLSDSKMAKSTGQIAQNVNFAISGQTLNSFLDSNKIRYQTGGVLAFDKSNIDLASEARKWTHVVECWK